VATNSAKPPKVDDLGFIADDDIGFVAEPAPKGRQVYEHPVGPEQDGLAGIVARFKDPERWQGIAGFGPQKANVVSGIPPIAAPAAALPGLAKLVGTIGAYKAGRVGANAISAGAQTAAHGGDASDIAKSAGIAGGIQAGAELIPVAGNALKSVANSAAFKSLGPYARNVLKHAQDGRIGEIGRELLDSKVIRWLPAGYKGLAERAKGVMEPAGRAIGEITKELSAGGAGVDRNLIATALEQKLIQPTELESVAKRNDFFRKQIERFRAGSASSLNDIHALKGQAKAGINWERPRGADVPDEEAFLRALYSELKDAISGSSRTAAAAAGSDVSDRLHAAKKTYGAAKEAVNVATGRDAREFANRFISPSDYITGVGGAIGGVALGGDSIEDRAKMGAAGLGLGLLNKLGRTYGNPLIAKGADAIGSTVLAASPLANAIINNPALAGLLTGTVAPQALQSIQGTPNEEAPLDFGPMLGSGDKSKKVRSPGALERRFMSK
jgi:hypothetical protein